MRKNLLRRFAESYSRRRSKSRHGPRRRAAVHFLDLSHEIDLWIRQEINGRSVRHVEQVVARVFARRRVTDRRLGSEVMERRRLGRRKRPGAGRQNGGGGRSHRNTDGRVTSIRGASPLLGVSGPDLQNTVKSNRCYLYGKPAPQPRHGKGEPFSRQKGWSGNFGPRRRL